MDILLVFHVSFSLAVLAVASPILELFPFHLDDDFHMAGAPMTYSLIQYVINLYRLKAISINFMAYECGSNVRLTKLGLAEVLYTI